MRSILVVLFLVLGARSAASEPRMVPGGDFDVVGDLSADYSAADIDGESLHEFSLRRAELGVLRLGPEALGGEILIEAIRSAGPDSFAGIDGDSLVMRLKRGWGYGRTSLGGFTFEGRVGLVPTPWVETTELDSRMRFLERLPAERLGVYAPSDLGAVGMLATADRRFVLSLGVFNGEGRNQREQNNGKNSQVMASGTLYKGNTLGSELELRVHAAAQEGSLGAAAARNHRFSLGVSALHRSLSAGLTYHESFGVGDVSSRRSRVLGLWLRAHWRELLWLTRIDMQTADLARDQTNSYLAIAGAFWRRDVDGVLMRVGLAARLERAQMNASSVPGLAEAGDLAAGLFIVSASFGGI